MPKCVQERIMGERDLETLRRWHKKAARVDSIGEFVACMEEKD